MIKNRRLGRAPAGAYIRNRDAQAIAISENTGHAAGAAAAKKDAR